MKGVILSFRAHQIAAVIKKEQMLEPLGHDP